MIILGIETSCDETAVALYHAKKGLLGHKIYSQITLHAKYGGVVPELASRDHIKHLTPLLVDLLEEIKLSLKDISAIAYTQNPGLVGALLVGATFAKSLAFALNIPTIGLNHMEGHLLAPFLEPIKPEFPFLALLVSGGHTQIVKVRRFSEYELLGETLDDAAGEAFDKTAKLLGLAYPGGPILAKLAEQGNAKKYNFPRPMLDRPGLDFSFSGLKTHVLNVAKQQHLDEQTKADIAAAFEDAVVDTLIKKLLRAIEQTGFTEIVVAGGVSANKTLRKRLDSLATQQKVKIYYPKLEFCTDNAAMIAYAGCEHFKRGKCDNNWQINVWARG